MRNTECEKKIKVVRLKDVTVDTEDLFRFDETPDDVSLNESEEEDNNSSGILVSNIQQHHHSIAYQVLPIATIKWSSKSTVIG